MKQKIYKSIIIIMIWITGLFAHGQEQTTSRIFTLNEAQEFALENNLNISNARLDVEHAENLIWENTAIGLPQINSSISYNNNLNLVTSLLPAEIFGGTPGDMIEVQFGTQHNTTASISASQLIFSGPYIVGLQAASIFKKSTEQNLAKKEIEIKELIAQNYYLALLAEESYIIIDSNVQNLSKTLYETQKMYEKGFVEETDVDQIRVSLISLKNSLRSAQTQIQVAYRLLKYQLGIDLSTEIELSENLNDVIQEISMEQTLVDPFNVSNHIDFQLLQTQEKLALMQLKLMKSEYFPSLNAVYNNNWSAMRNEFNFFSPDENWYYNSMLGFTLNIPIFSSGNRRARVSEKRIDYEKAGNAKK